MDGEPTVGHGPTLVRELEGAFGYRQVSIVGAVDTPSGTGASRVLEAGRLSRFR